MFNRIVGIFTAFCIIIGCLCLRLYSIADNPTKYVSTASSHYYTMNLSRVRGKILDCNGNKIIETQYDNYAVAKPTVKALSELLKILDENEYENVKARMENNNPIYINTHTNNVVENSDVINIKIYKRYSDNQIAQHILGYLNSSGDGVGGIEGAYNDILKTDKYISARIIKDADSRIINGKNFEVINDNADTSKITLTINSEIQRITENALDLYMVEKGCATVIDVKTGAIYACVSRPNYNSDNLADAIKSEDSPLVNRALQSFSVGSVFKVAVCMAALSNGIDDYQYTCTGCCTINSTTFHCYNSTAHGKIDMKTALEKSCNCYFINLARKIGEKKLLETVNLLSFGQENKLCDEISASSGIIPTAVDLSSSGELANFSFGQGKFTANIFQIAQMMMCVANSGKYIKPYLIENVVDEKNNIIEQHKENYPTVVISKNSADKLKLMLQSVVENGNGIKAKPSTTTAGGKTATAQTGTYDKDGNEIYNTWFAGFFPVDNPKYLVVILKQGGSSGANDNAPVFKMIADKITALDYPDVS